MLTQSPYILYSDGSGNIFEDTSLYVTGRTGWDAIPVPEDEWIELPEGGQLYELPGRRGIGIDVETGEMRLCEKGWAVAAFIPPAHTGFYLAAYETAPDAPTLPLFCYTAAGWLDEKTYVPCVRIEQDIRQDNGGYDQSVVEQGVQKALEAYPHNRLVQHLANNCALTYQCPAARNYSNHNSIETKDSATFNTDTTVKKTSTIQSATDTLINVSFPAGSKAVSVEGKMQGINKPVTILIPVKKSQVLTAVLVSEDSVANVRINQVIFGKDKADGPFGREVTKKVVEDGTCKIIISENMMQGDEWKGKFTLNLTLQ